MIHAVIGYAQEVLFGQPAWRSRFGLGKCLLLVGLFMLGIAHWNFFFQQGDFGWHAHDWPKDQNYYVYWQKALESGVWPTKTSHKIQGSDLLMANPEFIVSPQVLLLKSMSNGRFILVNTLIGYAVGFLGCLLLMRRFQLSLFGFAVLWLLFSFNGHLVAHLRAGHTMWNGYFLLPFFFLCTDAIVRNERPWVGAFGNAATIAAMFFQGSFHIASFCLMFLGLLCLANWSKIRWGILTAAMTVGLAALRIFPAVTSFPSQTKEFITGYPSLRVVFDALTDLRAPDTPEIRGMFGGEFPYLGWWEYDIFIGLAAFIFVAWFGVLSRMKREDPCLGAKDFRAYTVPITVMAFFSIGFAYLPISASPIPLFNAERATGRLLLLPVLALILIACVRFETTLPRWRERPALLWLAIVGWLVSVMEIATHTRLWQMPEPKPMRDLTLNLALVQDTADKAYIASLKAGAFVSAVSLVILIAGIVKFGWIDTRRNSPPVPKADV